ncbi:hypothetical protein EGT36_10640 [Agrobacterium sp. FDAARGOS_525]|nr:hypothetical protein EGT36_10640 [Agrobacterium sp. FDAARGOS_525]
MRVSMRFVEIKGTLHGFAGDICPQLGLKPGKMGDFREFLCKLKTPWTISMVAMGTEVQGPFALLS